MRKLKFSVILVVGLTLCLALATFAFAQKGSNKGKKGGKPDQGGGYLSVSVTFRDFPNPLDRITSDNGLPYLDGADGVLAIVGVSEGGFRLDTNGKGRTVNLDFSIYIPDSGTGELVPNGPYDIDLRIDEEFDETIGPDGQWLGTKLDIVEMAGGETCYGALSINFTPPGGRKTKLSYRMVFGSHAAGWPTCLEDRYPVAVTRWGTEEAPVNGWTISATTAEHACLWRLGNKSRAQIGFFEMPFSIDVVAIQ